MAPKIMKLDLIERINTGERYTYAAILSEGESRIRLVLEPIHMISYRAMLAHALEVGGVMFENLACDGRSTDDADRVWRILSGRAVMNIGHPSPTPN